MKKRLIDCGYIPFLPKLTFVSVSQVKYEVVIFELQVVKRGLGIIKYIYPRGTS